MTSRLQKEIEYLKKKLLLLVAEVEEQVSTCVNALQKRDTVMASTVIEHDGRIDRMEVKLEEDCLKVLALYQPVANDLRFIVSIMKITNDLERISDLAVNMAERSMYLITKKPLPISFDFISMADKVQQMVRSSINALVRLDAQTAYDVCAADDEVDAMNRDMYEIVEEATKRNPEDIKDLLHYLALSRHLERIADHATNIAEDVIYFIDGEIVRHHVEDYVED